MAEEKEAGQEAGKKVQQELEKTVVELCRWIRERTEAYSSETIRIFSEVISATAEMARAALEFRLYFRGQSTPLQ